MVKSPSWDWARVSERVRGRRAPGALRWRMAGDEAAGAREAASYLGARAPPATTAGLSRVLLRTAVAQLCHHMGFHKVRVPAPSLCVRTRAVGLEDHTRQAGPAFSHTHTCTTRAQTQWEPCAVLVDAAGRYAATVGRAAAEAAEMGEGKAAEEQ